MVITSHRYDVFLSFRDEDTYNNFMGFLYDSLKKRGIHTFIDELNLKKGEEISPTIAIAIEGSKFSLVVLSKNYAQRVKILSMKEQIE